MNMELRTDFEEIRSEPTETSVPAEVLPLRTVIDLIRRDSQRDPQEYLDETVVPHGGE